MTRTEIETHVGQVLAVVLKLPAVPAGPVLRADVPDWDSLNHVEIVYAVEESMDVTFSPEEIATLDSSDAIIEAVERCRAA
jgi:acyl carrier protein